MSMVGTTYDELKITWNSHRIILNEKFTKPGGKQFRDRYNINMQPEFVNNNPTVMGDDWNVLLKCKKKLCMMQGIVYFIQPTLLGP